YYLQSCSVATGRINPALLAGETLPRLACGLGAGVLRDDLLERAPRARVVAHLRIRARDIEERVRNFLAIGIGRDQLSLRRDGGAVILHRVLRIAGPVQRRGRERAPRVGAREALEA